MVLNGASGSLPASANGAASTGLTRGISDMITPGLNMTLWIRRGAVALILLAGVSVYAFQQGGGRGRGAGRGGVDEEEVILPNGKSQRDEILKSEHQQYL